MLYGFGVAIPKPNKNVSYSLQQQWQQSSSWFSVLLIVSLVCPENHTFFQDLILFMQGFRKIKNEILLWLRNKFKENSENFIKNNFWAKSQRKKFLCELLYLILAKKI